MSVVEVKSDPTPRDLVVFGVLWAVFFIFIGRLALIGADVLGYAAIATGVLFGVSLAFNRDAPRRDQAAGVLFPLMLAALWWGGSIANGPSAAAGSAWLVILMGCLAASLLGGVAAIGSARFGPVMYREWMAAVMPIGWSVSVVLLGVVFYGVVTPIGLAMRLLGRDPMQRAFEPDRESYWITHERVTDPKRYFRQF